MKTNKLDVGIRSLQISNTVPDLNYNNVSNGSGIDTHPCRDSAFNTSDCNGIVDEFQTWDHWFSPSQEALLVACYCTVMLLGLVGNSCVCYIVIKFKYLQKPRNILILNLSFCGILMCVACMPFSLLRLTLKNWMLGDIMCRISSTVQTIDVYVSTFTIVAIAVDRYSAIVRAQRDTENRTTVHFTIILIWLFSILFCIPMFSFHEVTQVSPELFEICMEVWPSDVLRQIYTTFVLIVQYVVPLTMISLLHGRICQFLRCRISENPITQVEVDRVLREIKRQRRNMLLLTGITISFALAWLPLTVMNTLADYDYRFFLNWNFNHAYAYCLLAAMCSACLNPIIYGWFNMNFRKAIIQVICPHKNVSNSPTEMATIRNDSRESSKELFRFYSSIPLATSGKRKVSSSTRSSNSWRSKGQLSRQIACSSPDEIENLQGH
ncbi:neuropeptide Y receptor type 6-like [Mya arenaria]|uniref:neuropeptide Y receptor type 6-like n=1 Tax=Mya arenaria TaxID=6604 RepID=UPI0022E2F35A|nr:neuropeptide Y receptor type 6-like [Mya arenaria]